MAGGAARGRDAAAVRALFPQHPAWWWLALATWGGLLFFLSSQSLPQGPAPQVDHLDKVAHFLYFSGGGFVLTGLLLRHGWSRGTRRLVWVSVLAMAVLGGLDEWHQTFTPGRSGNDPGDWLADVAGGLAGTLLALRWLGPGRSRTENAGG